ncbi:hypothetical protein [Arthrobacter sp. JUb115]|uniref:hypothetical protein n=1 Tax=Arthrobacter sp. JUb115 TaxID=2485108 RepID=UPI001060D9ED|nr:hypothetical protein [Arthrobacter sp. JUb115]TDU30522.1 hypothetical protein EDF61_101483 [Arthrobacter sp. JUb115]
MRRLLTAIFAALLALGLAVPAQATGTDENISEVLSQDQVKRYENLSDDDKNTLLHDVITEIGADECSNFTYYRKMESFLNFDSRNCEEQTRDALHAMYPDPDALIIKQEPAMDLCEALSSTGAGQQSVTFCVRKQANDFLMGWASGTLRNWMGQSEIGRSVLNAMDAIDNTIDFVADPKSGLEEVANSSKSESIALTSKVLEELTSTTEFDASSQEFKDRWALYAGIGVVGLSIMLLTLFKHHSNGEISDDDFSNSLLYYLPVSLFLVIYGPWAMIEIQQRIAPLTSGATDWSAEMISNFITVISRFASLESSSWFGPLAAIIFFGMLFIGSIALMIYFLLIPIFQQLMGLAIAALIGMLISPKTRRYVLKIASTLATLLILKPVVFLVMGAVFGVLASQTAFKEGTDDVLVNVGNLGATAFIMLLIVLSPAAIFRWMPIIQSREANFGGISPEISAGVGAAAGGMAGSLAGAGAGAVRRAISSRRGNASSGSSSSGSRSGNGASGGGAAAGAGSAAAAGAAGQGSSAARGGDDSSSPPSGSGTFGSPDAGQPQGSSNGQSSPGSPGQGAPTEVMERPTSPRTGGAGNASDSSGAGSPGTMGSSGRSPEGGPAGESTFDGGGTGTSGQAAGASGRQTQPAGPANSSTSATSNKAYRPLRTGKVGMLSNARYAMSNAAAQARIAQQDSDPDTWDSFKD